MGIATIVPNVVFPTSLPKMPRIDALESLGSLLLIDPGHSAEPWAAGVPSSGSAVPNLVRSIADTVLGQTTSSPVLTRSSSSGKGLVERTARGGLHVAQNETATSYGDASATISFPAVIASYISRYYNHDYFVSAWIRNTRAGAAFQDANSVVQLQSATQYGLALSSGSARYSSKNRMISYSANSGNHRVNALVDEIPESWGQTFFRASAAALGNAMGASTSDYGEVGSYILYRIYVEDLTVSGRSYEHMETLDAKMHAQAFGTGGRYAGDTFTSPTSI